MGGVPRKVTLLVICLLSFAGFTGVARVATGALAQTAVPSANAPCPVTAPTRTVPLDPAFGPDGFNYGSTRLRVQLNWPNGVLRAGVLPDGGSMATINPDGSVRAKVGWWVRDVGKLVIVGRRLDRPAPPLRAQVPSGYGPASDIGASLGFQPTGLTFPTVGCWRVVGKAGTARLTFVAEVTNAK
jgi:hypothetical protein